MDLIDNGSDGPRPAVSALRRGTNLSRVAGFNEAVVIDSVRRARDGLSRVEIAQQTGLSAQTVSNIVRRMIDNGLLQEQARISGGIGKPRTPLVLRPDGRHAVGVHLDPLLTTLVVLNLKGDVVAHRQLPTPHHTVPEAFLAIIADAIGPLLADAGVNQQRVVGIGFASPGPVDSAAGIVLDPPHLPDWRHVPLADVFAALTHLPVLLDKDVIAGVVGERWAGATMDHANSLFLYLSTGIGVGLTMDDLVIRGATGNAGDIGHLIVDPDGPPCPCGRRGCLGATLSPGVLVERAVAERALGGVHLDAVRSGDPARVDESFRAWCALVDAGDTAALRVLDVAARQLAFAVSTLANMTDTDIVALGGPTWHRLAEPLLPRLDALVRPSLVRAPAAPFSVVGTALGDDVIAIGAACMILDRAFSPALAAIALEE